MALVSVAGFAASVHHQEVERQATPPALDAPAVTASASVARLSAAAPVPSVAEDSTIVPFRIRLIGQDGVRQSGDLKDPENLTTGLVYDEVSGLYRYGTRLGKEFLYVPYFLAGDEVRRAGIQQSMRNYFRRRNSEDFKNKGKEKFDFSDMKFDLGPAEKIFGPGGVRVKTQGSAELKIGTNHRWTDNPSLSERNRSVFGFDFNEKVNLSLNGKVGDKVNMDFNYNSEATFNFDTQSLKLRYEGKEDEIVKLIEAGNVSMSTNSGLIRGAQSLFGARADLQFGRLKLQTMVAQKKSSAQSVQSKGGVQLTDYRFSAADYDENRHFFLGHFFRDNYDYWMTQLPTVLSGIVINRIEVWTTNKNGATTNTRNLVGLTDLGENKRFNSSLWTAGTTQQLSNNANTEYATVVANLGSNREISQISATLDGMGLVGGRLRKTGKCPPAHSFGISIERGIGLHFAALFAPNGSGAGGGLRIHLSWADLSGGRIFHRPQRQHAGTAGQDPQKHSLHTADEELAPDDA